MGEKIKRRFPVFFPLGSQLEQVLFLLSFCLSVSFSDSHPLHSHLVLFNSNTDAFAAAAASSFPLPVT